MWDESIKKLKNKLNILIIIFIILILFVIINSIVLLCLKVNFNTPQMICLIIGFIIAIILDVVSIYNVQSKIKNLKNQNDIIIRNKIKSELDKKNNNKTNEINDILDNNSLNNSKINKKLNLNQPIKKTNIIGLKNKQGMYKGKIERHIHGDFDEFLNILNNEILKNSASSTLEDQSDYFNKGIKCAVRVYERYSFVGKNRVSLNITLVGTNEDFFLSAIASGGSQAVIFKINTFGEQAFLDTIRNVIANYGHKNFGK